MAQALINNLNITKKTELSFKDNSSNAESFDFSKILKLKTAQNKDSQPTELNSSNQTNQNENTISDNKTDLNNNETDILNNEFNNAIQESEIETIIDLSVIKNFNLNENTEENTEENSSDNEITMEETNIEPIITEEGPTMLEDLTKMNDSAVAIIMHSQQISSVIKNTDENNTDSENDNSLNILDSKEQVLNNKNSFKQFDNDISKNVQTTKFSICDNTHTKNEKSSNNKAIDEKIVKELNVEVVNEIENSTNSGSADLMQNQTPQEHSIKAMIQSDSKFESNTTEVKTNNFKPTEMSSAKIIEQISKQLENMYNNSKLNIILNPEKLGKVNLQILNGKDGLMAQFTVTTQDAKDLLMKGLDGLKESLLAHGVSVDDVSVKVEETADNETNEDWTEQEGSRGGNKQQDTGKQKESKKTFEEIISENIENKEIN